MQDAVASLSVDLPLTGMTALESMVDQAIGPERFAAVAMSLAGIAGVFLASLGLTGLLSFFVSRATREIGLRMALGAGRGDVIRHVILRAAAPVGIGLGCGVVGALAATRSIESFLFDVEPSDPISFLVAGAVVIAAGLIAAWIPAWRAARLDPVRALRVD